jgi:MFS transporter, DHA2 family, multidrug resistance protein
MARYINKWLIALIVMLPTLMVIIDTSVVNVSLDQIRGSLSAGIDEATWSITSYLAANAIIIPMSGWLSSVFGRKNFLLFSVFLFTVSSLLCGLAWNIQSLIIFRIFQGLAGGSLQPISQAVLLETFPPVQHGMAMAIFGMGTMLGPIIGPLLGGWITDNWSWHWIFFVNVPFGVISIILSAMFISDPYYIKKTDIKIDYLGLVFLSLWVGCLQMLLDRGQREDWFESTFILSLTIIAVISFIMFLLVEMNTEQPIVKLRVFKDYSFGFGNFVMFIVTVNLFGSIVLLPIYLRSLMGYTASLAGLVLGPGGVAIFITMPIIGRMLTRVNPKTIAALGVIILGYAGFLMSHFNLDADFVTIFWPRVLMGIGMGMIFIPMTTLTLSTIKKEEMGNATSIFNLIRNLGGSLGVAFVATMLSSRSQFHQSRLVDHLTQLDLTLGYFSQKAAAALQYKGMDPVSALNGSLGVVYDNLLKQSYMMAFNDTFYFLFLMIMLTIPLIFLMRYKKTQPKQINRSGASL